MFERLNPAVLVLGGVVLAAVLLLIYRSQFSAEARLRHMKRLYVLFYRILLYRH